MVALVPSLWVFCPSREIGWKIVSKMTRGMSSRTLNTTELNPTQPPLWTLDKLWPYCLYFVETVRSQFVQCPLCGQDINSLYVVGLFGRYRWRCWLRSISVVNPATWSCGYHSSLDSQSLYWCTTTTTMCCIHRRCDCWQWRAILFSASLNPLTPTVALWVQL